MESRHDILARMLARLPLQEVTGPDGTPVTPLAALTTRDRDDPAIAVLDAWACALDVASFYLDRIEEEGYLATAREDRSVLELARTVGYEPRPGLAASVPLAFTLLAQPGTPETVTVPAGTKVQAVPGQDGRPRVFETIEDLDARPEWNTLPVAMPPALPVRADATVLALAAPAAPPAGEVILVAAGDGSPAQRYLPRVAGTAGDRSLRLQAALSAAPAGPEQAVVPPEIGDPVAYTLTGRLRPFGHDAPPFPADRRAREGGVYRYDPGTGAWTPRHDGLPSVAILAIAATTGGALYAAADGHGVFRSADLGVSWQPVATGQDTRSVRCLCAGPDGAVYAGGDDGAVFRSRDDGATWQRLGNPIALEKRLPRATVYAFAADAGRLFAGTDDGVFVSTDGGATWVAYGGTGIRAITLTGDEVVCATTRPGELLVVGVPGDGAPSIDYRRPARLAARFVRAVATIPAADWHEVTGLVILTDATLYPVGWQNATVALPAPGGLALARDGQGGIMVALAPGPYLDDGEWPSLEATDGQDWVDLDRVAGEVTAGRWLVLVGGDRTGAWPVTGADTVTRDDFGSTVRLTRVRLGAGPSLRTFLGPAVRTTEVLLSGDPLPLAAGPVTGARIILDGAVPPLPPGRRLVASGGPGEAAEIVTVAAMADERTVTLAAPFQGAYDAGTLTLAANVAMATHGETPPPEVHDGDGTAGQRFALAHAPLTYVPAATGTGSRDTLVVSVNGVPWREVATLNDSGATDQVYLVRGDGEGGSEVIFGDGVHGACPPPGEGTITAVYRYGLGPEGDVADDALVLLQTRPLGVREVTNPLPATGGVAAETSDSARTRLRQRLLALDRLVTPADFEHVALSFDGIAAAQATVLPVGVGGLLHLTVAGVGGQPVPDGSLLHGGLTEAIDARRPLGRPVRVETYTRLPFAISARLRTDRAHDRAAVRSAAEEAIAAAFTVGVRDFGRPVRRGELIALLQGVAGVVAVDLDGLGLEGWTTMPRRVLTCDRARWVNGTALPAELLVPRTVDLSLETGA